MDSVEQSPEKQAKADKGDKEGEIDQDGEDKYEPLAHLGEIQTGQGEPEPAVERHHDHRQLPEHRVQRPKILALLLVDFTLCHSHIAQDPKQRRTSLGESTTKAVMRNHTASIGSARAAFERAPRNPSWTYAETVLLLDLYQRAGRAPPTHPAVIETSAILRRLGREHGVAAADTYRNPEGVAMKLKAMAQQDPGWRKLGLKGLRPVAIDALVWSELSGDPQSLAARKASIIGKVVVDTVQPRPEGADGPRSSRGPAPSVGTISGERSDGEAVLYLLRLEGPVQALFAPRRVDPPLIVAKVGRSNDVNRRVAQLSAGFPPTSSLSWTLIDTVPFDSATKAHAAERLFLDAADASRWSIGGEFMIAPQPELLQLIREAQNRAKVRL